MSARGMRPFLRRLQEVQHLRVRVQSAWSRPSSTSRFDVEITEATPKRSELEEVPERRKVRKINGLAVCSTDIVGAAQADYDDPQSSGDEFLRKAGEEWDAVHTHEGEPMKSFEVPIQERDIVGVKSGVVLDPAKVQVARQKETDSIARHETSECKQGVHVKGGWVEDNMGGIVRSRFVAKRWPTTRETTSAKQPLRCSSSVSCSASRSPSRRAAGAVLRVQAHREHWSRHVAESGEALELAAGMD